MSEVTAQLKDWRFSIDRRGHRLGDVRPGRARARTRSAAAPLEELNAIIERVEAEARANHVRGLVLMSGKEKGFIVGADIREFENFETEQQVIDSLKPVNALLERIERLPVPVVAASTASASAAVWSWSSPATTASRRAMNRRASASPR